MKIKFLEHTADIQFIVEAKTLPSLFKNSLYAMIKSICKDKIKEKKQITLNIKAKDATGLLHNFLEEVVYIMDTEKFIPAKVTNLEISDNTLSATLSGDNVENYEAFSEIKAVTYNEMKIERVDGCYKVKITLDV